MEFGPLRGCNMKSIFTEKSYAKCRGETIPRPFFKKKSKLNTSLDLKFYTVWLLLYAKLRAIDIY